VTRWLRRALWLIALSCAACAGTETGNPDLSAPEDGGRGGERDAGDVPALDGGVTSDASPPQDARAPQDAAGGPDGGAETDASASEDAGSQSDAGADEDGG
jgi:hypothetical protein